MFPFARAIAAGVNDPGVGPWPIAPVGRRGVCEYRGGVPGEQQSRSGEKPQKGILELSLSLWHIEVPFVAIVPAPYSFLVIL